MITADLLLVLGIIITGFAVPSMLGAITDRRTPRAAAITILVGFGLILVAIQMKPGGYTLQQIPQAFTRVVQHFIN